MVGRLLHAAALASLLLLVAAGTAQRALADGTGAVLRCSVDQVEPTTGSQIHFDCSLIDNVGVPLSDTEVTFYVRTENKADASWQNGRKTTIERTDSSGQVGATLNAGQNLGNLGVLINYPGILSYYAFVKVVAAPPAAPIPWRAPSEYLPDLF